jgi:hypothetical protein
MLTVMFTKAEELQGKTVIYSRSTPPKKTKTKKKPRPQHLLFTPIRTQNQVYLLYSFSLLRYILLSPLPLSQRRVIDADCSEARLTLQEFIVLFRHISGFKNCDLFYNVLLSIFHSERFNVFFLCSNLGYRDRKRQHLYIIL